MDKIIKQWFHFQHEFYTKLAYILPWLPPYRYVFVLTNQCNMHCRYCFQDRRFDAEKTLMAQQWIDLSDMIPGACRITMTGGEPLILPYFKDVFKRIAERHPCNLIANGILLNEETVDFLLSFPKFKILAVSIDNLKTGGMNLREYSDGQWGHLGNILRYFVRRRNEIGSRCMLEIKTLILDENAESLFDIHRYCTESLKADHHTFQFLKGSPLQHADKNCRLEHIFEASNAPQYKKFDIIVNKLKEIKQYNIQHHMTSFLHPAVADIHTEKTFKDISFINSMEFQAGRFKACQFPWSSVHINYDGEVYPCLSVPMGNVKIKSLRDILSGEARRTFCAVLKKNHLVQACNRCGWLRQAH
jgi:MoaA/NifB/PqqE/SkfB family radical SAM enzyme